MENNNDTPRASPNEEPEAGSEDVEGKTSPDSGIQNPHEENAAGFGGLAIKQPEPGGPEGNGGDEFTQSPETEPGQAAEATAAPATDDHGGGTVQSGPPRGGNRRGGGKRPRTQAQREASRRNAKRSTGPRTAEGKAKVRLNPVKHGILSNEVLLTVGEVEDDQDEYDGLYRQMMERFHPRDFLEELEVRKIIGATWRMSRLLRYEAAAIQMKEKSITLQSEYQEVEGRDKVNGGTPRKKTLVSLFLNPVTMRQTLELLSYIRKSLEAGDIPDWSAEKLLHIYPECLTFTSEFVELLGKLRNAKAGNTAELQCETGPEYEEVKEELLDCLDAEIEAMSQRLWNRDERDSMALVDTYEMAKIPDEKTMNLIIRYGSYLEGIIARSMATLERFRGNNGNNGSRPGNGDGKGKSQITKQSQEKEEVPV